MSAAVVILSSVQGFANVTCQPVKNDPGPDILPKMPSLRTPADIDIETRCSQTDWSHPSYNWLYGDFDFLYPNNSYGKGEAAKVAKTRSSTYYLENIKRFQCQDPTSSARDKTIGYFAYNVKSAPAELTFLCVVPAQRSNNNGATLLALALQKSGDENLKISALPSAVPFYSSFDMDCEKDKEDKVTVTTFYTGTSGLERRFFGFNANYSHGRPMCQKIRYGCTTKKAYSHLVTLDTYLKHIHSNDTAALLDKSAASTMDCDSSIDMLDVEKTICEQEEHSDDLPRFCEHHQ